LQYKKGKNSWGETEGDITNEFVVLVGVKKCQSGNKAGFISATSGSEDLKKGEHIECVGGAENFVFL
jgi:hypothetical protein